MGSAGKSKTKQMSARGLFDERNYRRDVVGLNGANFRFKLKDGTIVDRTLTARPVADVPPGQQPSRYWIPAPWAGETEKGWRAAIDPHALSAPTYAVNGSWNNVRETMPGT